MLEVKSVDEVYNIISETFKSYKVGIEMVDIKKALTRVTACDVVSNECVPNFNRSSVDGFAVIASDTFGASESMPAQLTLVGEVKMGQSPTFTVQKGQAASIPTGGELPNGADSIVMVEYSENLDDGFIYLNKASAPSNNVVNKGDDIALGQVLIKKGQILRPQDIGVLAAVGQTTVEVNKKLKIGIISTGDEVVDIDKAPTGGKVRDVNSYTIFAGLKSMGAEPVAYGIVADSFDAVLKVTQKAISECDIVLISGGSSVGEKDETINIINTLGNVLVHGIAVKPGKPTIIGNVNGKAVFGLPGHPASAYFIFRLFVGFLIELINGTNANIKTVKAQMAVNYPSNNGREEYLPVKLEKTDNGLISQPVFGKSGLITMLSTADGYVRIPRGVEGLQAGNLVEVILF